jgi:Domain of unknown function (DUF222)
MITVHVNAATRETRAAGRCEIEEGPSIAAETARRIACDASVVSITENERGEPLDIGRKSRSIPPGIRRALRSRDKGCRFPGCIHHRYVDGHHIQHWVDGGETKLTNLVLLRRYHHRLVHEGGAVIQVLDDGALRFCQANGKILEPWVPKPFFNPSRYKYELEPNAALTRWHGERMDYDLAVAGLMERNSA